MDIKKGILITLICFGLVGFISSAQEEKTSPEISADIDVVSELNVGMDSVPQVSEDIGIVIEGQDFGKWISPIVYEGRAYLPVRFLAELLGTAVFWNEDERTIELGEKDKGIGVNVYEYEDRFNSEYTTDEDILNINGDKGEYGIVFRKDFGDSGSDSAGYINYAAIVKPYGAYQKFGGAIHLENDTNADEVLFKFYENYARETLIKEIRVKRGERVDFEIDIPGVQSIYIYQRSEDRIEKYSDPVKMVIMEPYFK